jgi:hypothetical protein
MAIGLLVGALLTEGALLVPYWRSLPAEAFSALHQGFGPRLYGYFAPLTIISSVLTFTTAAVCMAWPDAGSGYTLGASVCMALVLVTYTLYFKHANARFAQGGLSPEELRAELARWAMWHWGRVGFGVVGFAAAILAVGADASTR